MTRKEEITAKIQNAAIKEFVKKGFTPASMENIAKIAEVSKRTLYKYYPNKDAIFDSIISFILESFAKFTKITYSKEKEIEEQLESIINAKVELLTSEKYTQISKMVLSELLKSKKLNEAHLIQLNESEQRFVTWIEDAKSDGKIVSTLESEIIANQFHSILKGQIFYPVIFGFCEITTSDIENSKKTTLDFFLKSFC